MKASWRNWVAWLLAVLAGIAMTLAGTAKLTTPDRWDGMFREFGYPNPFLMVYLTGALELTGGLRLLAPPLAPYGAMLVGAVMIGAAASHLVTGIGSPFGPLILLLLASVVGYLRGPRRWVPGGA